MKIAGCGTLEEIGSATWPKFATDVGMAAPFVRSRVLALTNAAREHVERVATQLVDTSDLDCREMQRYVNVISGRAERLATTASGEIPSARPNRRPLRQPKPTDR